MSGAEEGATGACVCVVMVRGSLQHTRRVSASSLSKTILGQPWLLMSGRPLGEP